jgi:hypothetical protein
MYDCANILLALSFAAFIFRQLTVYIYTRIVYAYYSDMKKK